MLVLFSKASEKAGVVHWILKVFFSFRLLLTAKSSRRKVVFQTAKESVVLCVVRARLIFI